MRSISILYSFLFLENNSDELGLTSQVVEMSLRKDKVSIDFSIQTVGKWQETYQWIPVFGAFAAIATAILAGANNLPAPVSALNLFFLRTHQMNNHACNYEVPSFCCYFYVPIMAMKLAMHA